MFRSGEYRLRKLNKLVEIDHVGDKKTEGRMNTEQYRFLKMLTFGTYNELFEQIKTEDELKEEK